MVRKAWRSLGVRERERRLVSTLFVSHLGKKQLGQRSSYQLVSLASFHAVASC
jgi:hypothetical protein